MKPSIETWPMGTYPWRTKEERTKFGGKVEFDIHTNFFKAEVRNYDGTMAFQTFKMKDERGNIVEVAGPPKEAGVKSVLNPIPPEMNEDATEWAGNKSRIWPVDLRAMEKALGGQPTSVLAGLWFKYIPETESWEAVDQDKVRYPLYWTDVSERYFNTWRPAAYQGFIDPYKNQKRPITRMMELQMANKKLEEDLLAKQRELEISLRKTAAATPNA